MTATNIDTRVRLLYLKPGRDRSVRLRHPWVFTGAVARAAGPADAPLAHVIDSAGQLLGRGFHSPNSQIVGRILVRGDEELTPDLVSARIRTAADRRQQWFEGGGTDAWRAVHSEGDELSGLVIDRYRDVWVVEIGSWGFERWKDVVLNALRGLGAKTIVLRNDIPSRGIEKLSREDEVIGEPLERVVVQENALRFIVDIGSGQKTGFFLDQRRNRQLVRDHARGKRVLNLFSYTGGFGVYAAAGGASSVDEVDVSGPALDLATENHALNGLPEPRLHAADAFEWTREQVRSGENWDLVVCDPPAFARSRGDVDRAARGYKDINLQALKLVTSGGLLATFSCSGHIDIPLFQKIIFGAARDAGRRASILQRLGAGADHPVSIDCPEGEYLKGLLLRVD